MVCRHMLNRNSYWICTYVGFSKVWFCAGRQKNFYSEFSLTSCHSAYNREFKFLHTCVGKGNATSGPSVGVACQLVWPAFSVSPGCALPAATALALLRHSHNGKAEN